MPISSAHPCVSAACVWLCVCALYVCEIVAPILSWPARHRDFSAKFSKPPFHHRPCCCFCKLIRKCAFYSLFLLLLIPWIFAFAVWVPRYCCCPLTVLRRTLWIIYSAKLMTLWMFCCCAGRKIGSRNRNAAPPRRGMLRNSLHTACLLCWQSSPL